MKDWPSRVDDKVCPPMKMIVCVIVHNTIFAIKGCLESNLCWVFFKQKVFSCISFIT